MMTNCNYRRRPSRNVHCGSMLELLPLVLFLRFATLLSFVIGNAFASGNHLDSGSGSGSDSDSDADRRKNASNAPPTNCEGGSCPIPAGYRHDDSTGVGGEGRSKGSNPDHDADDEGGRCGLWLGPSPIKSAEFHGFGLGMFTGRFIPKGQAVESILYDNDNESDNDNDDDENDNDEGGEAAEVVIPIFGADSLYDTHPPLREYVWDGDNMPEVASEYPRESTALFIPGLASIAPCTSSNFNLALSGTGKVDGIGRGHASASGGQIREAKNLVRSSVRSDSGGVHRSTHATAGSFAYRQNVRYVAVRDIVPGEELTVECSDDSYDGGAYYLSSFAEARERDGAGGAESGYVFCVDSNVRIGRSSVDGAGRGLFARRRLERGGVIISSPVVPVHRDVLNIRVGDDTDADADDGDANAKQLLLNYCYGHPNSDVLLLPYGPLVNYINHGGAALDAGPTSTSRPTPSQSSEGAAVTRRPNAELRWHPTTTRDNESIDRRMQHHHPELLDMSADRVTSEHGMGLVVDIVALRDVESGEEIFIDYGKDWADAYRRHVRDWTARRRDNGDGVGGKEKVSDGGGSDRYTAAEDYIKSNGGDGSILPTIAELAERGNGGVSYPNNLATYCYHEEYGADDDTSDDEDDDDDDDDDGEEEEYNDFDKNEDDNHGNDEGDEKDQISTTTPMTKKNMAYYDWNEESAHGCFRPCSILERYKAEEEEEDVDNDNDAAQSSPSTDRAYLYTVEFHEKHDDMIANDVDCAIKNSGRAVVVVSNVPRRAIRIVDRPYTSDVFLVNAFRHEIGVPDNGFYPKNWMRKKLRGRSRSESSSLDGKVKGDEFKRRATNNFKKRSK